MAEIDRLPFRFKREDDFELYTASGKESSVFKLKVQDNEPKRIPDLYADKRNILGNLLHNPRYTGNIVVTEQAANLPRRVHFIDAGSLSGPGKEYGALKSLLYPIDLKFQLLQLIRWQKKLQKALG